MTRAPGGYSHDFSEIDLPGLEEIPAAVGGGVPMRHLLNSLSVVSAGTLIGMALNVATTLIAPRLMTRVDYGLWRTLVLYSTYAGLFHFGLLDGLLLLCSGRSADACKSIFGRALAFLLVQQTVLLLLCWVLLAYTRIELPALPWLLLACALVNVVSLFQYVLQASRRFKSYVASLITAPLALAVAVCVLGAAHLLTFGTAVAATLVSSAAAGVVGLAGAHDLLDFAKLSFATAWRSSAALIRSGSWFLLGNFLMVLFFSLDRLVASRVLTASDFALYAFPVSLVTSIYTLVNSVTTASFPHLAGVDKQALKNASADAKLICIAVWGVGLAAYFVFGAYVRHLLPGYQAAMPVLMALLLSVGPGTLIRSMHFNYYRVALRQRSYLTANVLAVVVIALGLGIVVATRSYHAIAWVPVAGSLFWVAINEWQLRDYRAGTSLDYAWLAGLLAYGVGFWMTSHWAISPTAALLVYAGMAATISLVLFAWRHSSLRAVRLVEGI